MSVFLVCCVLVSMFGALCYAGRLIMKEDQFVQSIKGEHKTLLLTVNAQRKDIEGYLQQIGSLEEHCVAQKKVVDEYYAQIKDLKQKLGVVPFERAAFESQIEDLTSDLKEREETIRKLNRRAQKAESELIKSQKYHKNTKTYFKDRLEWSLDALKDARNLVTQLGNKIDWHMKTCNPFEKKEAKSPQNGFQGDPSKENLSHIAPGSTFEMDENGKVGKIWPPTQPAYEPGELLTADSKGNLIKVEAEDTIRGEVVKMGLLQVQKAVNQSTPWIKITTPVPPEAQPAPHAWLKKGWSTFATVKPEGDSMVMHKETK